MGMNVECKCEWLSPTSYMNEWNIEFIREKTHIHNIFRF